MNFGDTGEFVFNIEDVVEFLEVSDEQTCNNIIQVVSIFFCFPKNHYDLQLNNSQWNLQPGKLYLPVYTCRNGLWRFLMDDVLEAVGFHPHNGLPVFKFSFRKGYVKC